MLVAGSKLSKHCCTMVRTDGVLGKVSDQAQGGSKPDMEYPATRFVEYIIQRHLKEQEDIQFREPTKSLVRFIRRTTPLVKSALSAQPYAQLAWCGVSMLPR